jgi:hypothetical protein
MGLALAGTAATMLALVVVLVMLLHYAEAHHAFANF